MIALFLALVAGFAAAAFVTGKMAAGFVLLIIWAGLLGITRRD